MRFLEIRNKKRVLGNKPSHYYKGVITELASANEHNETSRCFVIFFFFCLQVTIKRKADAPQGTPKLMKKMKIEEKTVHTKSSLLDHLKL